MCSELALQDEPQLGGGWIRHLVGNFSIYLSSAGSPCLDSPPTLQVEITADDRNGPQMPFDDCIR